MVGAGAEGGIIEADAVDEVEDLVTGETAQQG